MSGQTQCFTTYEWRSKSGHAMALISRTCFMTASPPMATSHHLGVLRKAGLADSSRECTRHLFAVDTDGLTVVRSYLDDFWPDKLVALKAAVEARKGVDHG